MDLNELAVDPAIYENGKKIELGSGAHFSVRSAGSERATKVRERLWKPYSTWKDVPKDVLDRLNADWCAQGLLAEFVGFTDAGTPVVVDLSKAEDQARLAQILRQPKSVGLRGRIIKIAIDESNYQAAEDDVTEGKSVASPDGSSASGEAPTS